MKKETIDQLYKAFEQYALEVNGVECWSARELQKLLGYSKWENFTNVINISEKFGKMYQTIFLTSGRWSL